MSRAKLSNEQRALVTQAAQGTVETRRAEISLVRRYRDHIAAGGDHLAFYEGLSEDECALYNRCVQPDGSFTGRGVALLGEL
jgi:hypothetical protein